MEEPELLPFHLVSLTGPEHLALMEIPVSDVPTWVAQDSTVEHPRNEVDPTLIDEPHVPGIIAALSPQAFLPEGEERPRALTHPDEPEVVDTDSEDRALARHLPVAWEWCPCVRNERDLALLCYVRQLVETIVDTDVRIEIED